MMANHMLIEVDHLSKSARDEVLSIATEAHGGFLGVWLGTDTNGFSSLPGPGPTPPSTASLPVQILRRHRHVHPRAHPYTHV